MKEKSTRLYLRVSPQEKEKIDGLDANLQREKILPSERAFAYKMKLEAIKHQGKASANGPTQSADLISDESGRQIQRYIRLTYLIPELLQMVDEGRMAMSPAVEISFLKEPEQRALLNAMEYCDCTPSHAQSIQLKRLSQVDALDNDLIRTIMGQPKPNQVEQIKLRRDDFSRYFPADYSAAQIKADIQKGLELLKRQRERNKNARIHAIIFQPNFPTPRLPKSCREVGVSRVRLI